MAAYEKDPTRSEEEGLLPHPEDRNLNPFDGIFMFIVITAPAALLVTCFSHMGYGLLIFNTLSDKKYTLEADALSACLLFLLILYYVLDWARCWLAWKAISLLAPFLMAVLAGCYMAASFPFLPIIACVFAIVYFLIKLRHTCMKKVRRTQFWFSAAIFMLLAGVLVVGLFLRWWACDDWTDVAGKTDSCTMDNLEGKGHKWTNETRHSMSNAAPHLVGENFRQHCLRKSSDPNPFKNFKKERQTAIRDHCIETNTVLYLIWVLPVIVGFLYIAGAMFMLFAGVCDLKIIERPFQTNEKHTHMRVHRSLKLFTTGIFAALAAFYIGSTSLSYVQMNLSHTVCGMAVLSIGVIVLWLSTEVELDIADLVVKEAENSQFAGQMMDFLRSDWGRAMMAGSVGILSLFYLGLNRARKCVRRLSCCQKTNCCFQETVEEYEHAKGATESGFDKPGKKAFEEISQWPTVGVFLKICLLGELFFTFQVGVAKATFVFLSGLNDHLAEQKTDFPVVMALVFAVGFAMFLLPPVPGVPVYIFCGIVVAKQGQDEYGFYGAVGIAILLGFTLKIVASCGQYLIGFAAGRNVKIQQLIGVDKVPTRAIEKILREPGLKMGKVAVLVGGPDWPTSVTCGILKLNICQMILGTCPVIFVMAPCVLAGAYMSLATPGVPSSASTLAGVFVGLSSLMQGGSMFEAMRTIANTIASDEGELSKPREEHKEVEALTEREKDYNKAYTDTVAWKNLNCFLSFIIFAAAGLIYSSCAVFALKASLAFENFEVSGHIKDDLCDYGLGGNALNVVRPAGVVLLAMFAAGVVMHIFFSWVTGCLAQRRLKQAVQRLETVEG